MHSVPFNTLMPKLTKRRQLETRTDIAHTAVALFHRNGFDSTTMNDVAEAAGVSRRTVYRHFPTKDDLVFEYPRRWLEQFEDEISRREADESLRNFCRRALLTITDSIQEHSEQVLAAFSLLQTADSLRGTHGKSDDVWIQHYLDMFMTDPAFTPDDLRVCAVVAAATNAGTNTAIALWAMGDGLSDLGEITTAILDQLDPIWPDAFR